MDNTPNANFPGWRYHKSGAKRLFQTEQEFQDAGAGWRDMPWPVSAAPGVTDGGKPCPNCAHLVNENASMRKQFDISWKQLRDQHESIKSHAVILEETNRQLTRQLAELQGKLAQLEAEAQAAPDPEEPEPPQPADSEPEPPAEAEPVATAQAGSPEPVATAHAGSSRRRR